MYKIFLYFLLGIHITVFSQSSPAVAYKGIITGKVTDDQTNLPVEYANIAIFRLDDSSLVNGTVSEADGTFRLELPGPGQFYAEVKFIGYETKIIRPIVLTAEKNIVDLEEIRLPHASKEIEGVDVLGDKAPIVYRIDKKVINPDQFPSATGGNALDVLQQTPSITVDIEGNVTMRGSENFTVLVDGRPSPFEGSDALQQIPTSSIENIEIITNPSAKYDPEGTAGIINIITNNTKLRGLSGRVTLQAGTQKRYGGDVQLSYRTNKFILYGGLEYNNRTFEGEFERLTRNAINDTTYILDSYGEGKSPRYRFNSRIGAEWHLTEKTTYSGFISYGQREWERTNTTYYREYSIPASTDQNYTGINGTTRDGEFFALTNTVDHKFNEAGHEIYGELYFRIGGGDEIVLNETTYGNGITEGYRYNEGGDGTEIRAKVDYVLPLGVNSEFQAGWQSEFEIDPESSESFFYDHNLNEYVSNNNFIDADYDKNIHAIYSIFNTEINKFGLQAGLRVENTDRLILITDTEQRFEINRWDYFPTFHFSFSPNDYNQTMMSYTRRINRPRGYYLEPFVTYSDPFNAREGNPGLTPEYVDSYEGGYIWRNANVNVSFEAFYRNTKDKIERVRTPLNETVVLGTFENVGEDHSVGLELMMRINFFQWWLLNATGTAFNYKVTGQLYGKDFSEESFNWTGRFSNLFNVTEDTRLQLDGVYVGPSITAQGERSEFFGAEASVRQEFWKDKLAITIQARDIFNTFKREFIARGPNFYNYFYLDPVYPQIRFTLEYRFNNYTSREERELQNGNGINLETGGGEGGF